MKYLVVVLLISSIWIPLFAQENFSVSTDKPIYRYGDSIHITITAVNGGASADTLVFGSSCQVNYYVDNFNLLAHWACAQIFTSRVIPAHDSAKWSAPYLPPYPVTRDTIAVGKHAIVGEIIRYWISDTIWITVNPAVGVARKGDEPHGYVLYDNYPNPFNPSTTVKFSIPRKSWVRVTIFNLLGQQVAELANEELGVGNFERVWTANVASGLYFYRLEAMSVNDPGKRFVDVKKMILLR